MRAVIVLMSLLLMVNPSQAANKTAQLIDQCRTVLRIKTVGVNATPSTVEYLDSTACVRYLGGFVDGYGLGTQGKGLICPPAGGLDGHQLAAVFVQWAEKNPAQWHQDRAINVGLALVEAFPCGR
jgi:Rap1a immunity proteins